MFIVHSYIRIFLTEVFSVQKHILWLNELFHFTLIQYWGNAKHQNKWVSGKSNDCRDFNENLFLHQSFCGNWNINLQSFCLTISNSIRFIILNAFGVMVKYTVSSVRCGVSSGVEETLDLVKSSELYILMEMFRIFKWPQLFILNLHQNTRRFQCLIVKS